MAPHIHMRKQLVTRLGLMCSWSQLFLMKLLNTGFDSDFDADFDTVFEPPSVLLSSLTRGFSSF